MNTAPIVSKVWSFCTTLLRELGTQPGMPGQIFTKVQYAYRVRRICRFVDRARDQRTAGLGTQRPLPDRH